MQFLADILSAPVDRPIILENTALGAAYLAGLSKGIFPPPEEFADCWQRDMRFSPSLAEEIRIRKYNGWKDAVKRTLSRQRSSCLSSDCRQPDMSPGADGCRSSPCHR
jgi:glycerol kinase